MWKKGGQPFPAKSHGEGEKKTPLEINLVKIFWFDIAFYTFYAAATMVEATTTRLWLFAISNLLLKYNAGQGVPKKIESFIFFCCPGRPFCLLTRGHYFQRKRKKVFNSSHFHHHIVQDYDLSLIRGTQSIPIIWTNIFYFKLAKIFKETFQGMLVVCLDIEFLNFTTAEISTFLTTLFMVMK